MNSKPKEDQHPSRGFWKHLRSKIVHSVLWRYDAVEGYRPVIERLLRIRMSAAIALSMPFLILMGVYVFGTVAEHRKYNLAVKIDEPLTMDLFHLRLHDRLTQDWRRLMIPDLDGDSNLPVYSIRLSNQALETLEKNLPPGKNPGSDYVEGYVSRKKKAMKAEFRIRGSRHWNWITPQKSWKVRLHNNHYLDGRDVFSFVNPVDPLPFAEELILDMAREQDLLSPEYHPIRLTLNNAYMGLYFYMAQPDENLLRKGNRFPGNLYSGDGAPEDPNTGVSALFESSEYWKRPGTLAGTAKEDRTDLDALLFALNKMDPVQFRDYANSHIDMRRFATFDALDVVFGGDQHDYAENHKLYFDPYRGKVEPIAWNFSGWEHSPRLSRTENPIQLRLKEIPGYLDVRNRIAYRLITGPCAPEAIEARSAARMNEVAPALLADPFWDAYRLMPDVSRYYRQMVRPMDFEQQSLVFDARMQVYRNRWRFLMETLEQGTVDATVIRHDPLQAVEFTVDGNNSVRLDAWLCHGKSVPLKAFADANLDGRFEADTDRSVADFPHLRNLAPGFHLSPRRTVNENRGAVRLETIPQQYRFFVVPTTECPLGPDAVRLNRRTIGDEITIPLKETSAATEMTLLCDAGTPPTSPGRLAPHPWCFPDPPLKPYVLGPGNLVIDKTLELPAGQELIIEPGTQILMGEGVSIIARGRVTAVGTKDKPIWLLAKDKPWGVLAMVGEDASGSRLEHVKLTRGSSAKLESTYFSASMSIHDCSDVVMDNCLIEKAAGQGDALHLIYVDDYRISDVRIEMAQTDALDIEYSKGKIDGLRVVGAGDECLDLMGGKTRVTRSLLWGCGGNAISAGERNRLRLDYTLLGNSPVGVQSKNGSTVRIRNTLAVSCNIAFWSQRYDARYDRRSRITLREVACVDINHYEGGKGRIKGNCNPDFKAVELDELTDWLDLDETGHPTLGEVLP